MSNADLQTRVTSLETQRETLRNALKSLRTARDLEIKQYQDQIARLKNKVPIKSLSTSASLQCSTTAQARLQVMLVIKHWAKVQSIQPTQLLSRSRHHMDLSLFQQQRHLLKPVFRHQNYNSLQIPSECLYRMAATPPSKLNPVSESDGLELQFPHFPHRQLLSGVSWPKFSHCDECTT